MENRNTNQVVNNIIVGGGSAGKAKKTVFPVILTHLGITIVNERRYVKDELLQFLVAYEKLAESVEKTGGSNVANNKEGEKKMENQEVRIKELENEVAELKQNLTERSHTNDEWETAGKETAELLKTAEEKKVELERKLAAAEAEIEHREAIEMECDENGQVLRRACFWRNFFALLTVVVTATLLFLGWCPLSPIRRSWVATSVSTVTTDPTIVPKTTLVGGTVLDLLLSATANPEGTIAPVATVTNQATAAPTSTIALTPTPLPTMENLEVFGFDDVTILLAGKKIRMVGWENQFVTIEIPYEVVDSKTSYDFVWEKTDSETWQDVVDWAATQK